MNDEKERGRGKEEDKRLRRWEVRWVRMLA